MFIYFFSFGGGGGRWASNQQPILRQDIQLWTEGPKAVLLSKALAPQIGPKGRFSF